MFYACNIMSLPATIPVSLVMHAWVTVGNCVNCSGEEKVLKYTHS